MTLTPHASSILLVLVGLHVLASPVYPQPPLPDPSDFLPKVRDAVRLDYELQTGFTYIEQRRDVKVSKTGKLTLGPLRTFEVYPSSEPGGTYKRLIAIDGEPLDAAELARRDAEHERHLRDQAEQRRVETPQARADRLRKEAEERREREAILDDALAVYEIRLLGRETLDGQPVIAAAVTPRPHVRVTTREGGWMKQFAGRIWISENDHQIARLDLQALDDISIGWGILGRVHKGSRFLFARQRVEGVWLPAEVTFEASGRTLLFRPFRIQTVTTYSNYRKLPAAIASSGRRY